jgi:hypothetical protein
MTFSLLLIWLLADYISYEIDVEIGVQEWEYFKDKPAKLDSGKFSSRVTGQWEVYGWQRR